MSKHRKHHHGEEPFERVTDEIASELTSIRKRVNSAFKSTKSTVGNAIPTKNDLRNLSGTVVGAIKRNPIGMFLGALAAGFLVGSLLPKTPVEDERLGALKDTLQARTQTMGAQAVEHGKAIIRDTLEAAQQSAQQHGADFAEEVRASV
jgi:hypothetical protein